MLKRRIFDVLLNWKKTKKKKCLIVQGARQVGKTYIIREFGSQKYDEVFEINFKEQPDCIDIFSNSLSIDNLIMAIRFRFPQVKLIPGKTLIFFDEIQECEEAITSLKFWAEDNRYDVIASGSMLGIDYKRASSYPVGYVDHIQMFGLDFEEFLWAKGITGDLIAQLKTYYDNLQVVPDSVNNSIMNIFREYISVGGMPEVVDKYIETNDFREVDKIQRNILLGYQYDIAHYATAEEKVKAEKCYLSLSKQLLDKENHKFQYKDVEHGGRAQKYYSSIEWLLRADIISLCRLVTDIKFDLDDYARNDFFRAYATDLSLLVAMKDYSLKQHIIENTLVGNTKGGIFECAIADILIKKEFPLYYYKNESTNKEIDFLIQIDGEVVPVEVKSANNPATSLKWLRKRNPDIKKLIKLIDGNIGVSENGIITLPNYMAMFF